MNAPQCSALTLKGQPCNRPATESGSCATHDSLKPRCGWLTKNGKPCSRLALPELDGLCRFHGRSMEAPEPVLSLTVKATNVVLTGGPLTPGQIVRVVGTWLVGAEEPCNEGTKWRATPVEVELLRDVDAPVEEDEPEWWSAEATTRSLAAWEEKLERLRRSRGAGR